MIAARRMRISLALLALAVAPSPAAADPLRSYDFFREPEIDRVTLSPAGDLHVGLFTRYAITTVRISDLDGKRTFDLHRYFGRMQGHPRLLQWVGDRTLLISTVDGDPEDVVRVRLSATEISVERTPINWSGVLVDPLRQDEESVLWSPYEDPSSVYRVAVDALASPADGSSPFGSGERVARMEEPVAAWHCDGGGTPRLAEVRRPGGFSEFWMASEPDDWERIRYTGASEDDWVWPVGLTRQGRVLVASPVEQGRVALHTWEPADPEPLRLVAQHPERDVVSYYRMGGVVWAGLYVDRGRPRLIFLDPEDQQRWDALRARFAEPIVFPLGGQDDGGQWVLLVADTDPGRIVVAGPTQETVELGRVSSRTRPELLGTMQVFEREVPEVGTIEAYLTLPPSGEPKPPLVVYPHGGPIGVMDISLYDPRVHFLANRGFAVLQVNYRGSAGWGLGFMKAGWRQWGRGIEDDIDAMVDRVTERGLVNDYRVCIIGESYGGYSALMSVVRHPNRYRCAVSTAGVTDIGLMFSSSDFAESESGRERMAKQVGDPDRDYEEMKEFSPVYRAEEIRTPVLLIHGDEDRRVDIEHMYRMSEMLRLYGKEHKVVTRRGLGHGDDWSNLDWRDHFETVADFLDFHLD